MNDEMMAHTFVVESMTVEAGRIIPSPALAEAVIGGIAQIIAERDALKAQWAGVPWDALEYCINVADRSAPTPQTVPANNWLDANAPKQEAAE